MIVHYCTCISYHVKGNSFCLHDLHTLTVSPPEPRTFSGKRCVPRWSSSMWSRQPWRSSMSCCQPRVSSAHHSPSGYALAKTFSSWETGPVWWGHQHPGLGHSLDTSEFYLFFLLVFSPLYLATLTNICCWQAFHFWWSKLLTVTR